MPEYQGHKNWNYWNVSLWIGNDEGLYRLALDCIRNSRRGGYTHKEEAALSMLEILNDAGYTKTPDGAPYTVGAIRAAMVGLE